MTRRDPDQVQMTFGEHLEELRRRIILSLIGVVVAAVVTFSFGFRIIGWLAQPYIDAQFALGFSPVIIATDFTVGFTTYMKVALIAAAVLASPWILYQGWLFVVEGLYEHERRAAHILWPFSTVMMAAGVGFAYYVLLPVTIVFFLRWTTYYPPMEPGPPGVMLRMMGLEADRPLHGAAVEGDETTSRGTLPLLVEDPPEPVEGQVWVNVRDSQMRIHYGGQTRSIAMQSSRLISPFLSVNEYVGSAAIIGLGVVAAFQLPVIMLVIGWTGLIDPAIIASARRYAVFGLLCLAALLTPADVLSMFVLFVPLYTLFELGLLLMRWTRRRHAPQED